jgi:hypothetical protein
MLISGMLSNALHSSGAATKAVAVVRMPQLCFAISWTKPACADLNNFWGMTNRDASICPIPKRRLLSAQR